MTHEHEPLSNEDQFAFCPRCAAPLKNEPMGDKIRPVCVKCGFIHFADPKVGVGALVLNEGKILLVKRAMSPEIGKWSIPAGFLDYGEDPKVTAQREVFEETNLKVEIGELMDVYYNADALEHGGASIFILYHGRLSSGELRAGDDADSVGFFAPDELPDLAFASTHDAIRQWRQETKKLDKRASKNH